MNNSSEFVPLAFSNPLHLMAIGLVIAFIVIGIIFIIYRDYRKGVKQ